MAEDSATVSGIAGTLASAETTPVPVLEPIAPAERPTAVASSAKGEFLSVAASAIGHLFVGLLVFGSMASMQKPPEVFPVKLIPADQAPKPPQPQPDKKVAQPEEKAATPEAQKPPPAPPVKAQQSPLAPPPKAAAAASPNTTSAAGKQPPPGSAKASGPKQDSSWKNLAASLGLADYGRKTTVAPTLLAELRAQAKRCWTVPSGWRDPQEVSVTLRFQLKPDGALEGDPAVVEFPATILGAKAAKAAIVAIERCGPYRLPAAQYDQWKDIQVELTP